MKKKVIIFLVLITLLTVVVINSVGANSIIHEFTEGSKEESLRILEKVQRDAAEHPEKDIIAQQVNEETLKLLKKKFQK